MDDYPNLKNHLDKYKNIISSDNKPYGLHRSRKEEFFKGEKIAALRKSPKMPVFSYSNFDCYLPASYYVIKTTRFSYKYLLGLLNSKLIAFWLKYKGKMQGENYQLDKTPLLQIPIKSSDTIEIIEDIVDRILEYKNKQANTRSLENEIDDYIYEIYDISKEEKAIIEEDLNY